MKPYHKMSLLIIALGFLMLGCDESEEIYYAHPHVVMKSITTVDGSVNEPAKIYVEFENVGGENALDLSGLLSLHINNTIIESQEFFFREIVSGGSITAIFRLKSVATHSEYKYFSLDFSWYDDWGQVYE